MTLTAGLARVGRERAPLADELRRRAVGSAVGQREDQRSRQLRRRLRRDLREDRVDRGRFVLQADHAPSGVGAIGG
jgi:hypothetical protein